MEAGTLPSVDETQVTYDAGDIPVLAQEFAIMENNLKKNWQEQIELLNKKGGVAIWGAGAKGVTFANLVDPNQEHIACVVDVNPRKQGHFLSGTGHPIVKFHALPSYRVTTVILMNPNYHEEVAGLLRDAKMDIQILDLANEVEENQ
jgi:hypothetical protein